MSKSLISTFLLIGCLYGLLTACEGVSGDPHRHSIRRIKINSKEGIKRNSVGKNDQDRPSPEILRASAANPFAKSLDLSLISSDEAQSQIETLELILGELSSYYLGAIFSITENETIRPKHFFEEVRTSLNKRTKLVVLNRRDLKEEAVRAIFNSCHDHLWVYGKDETQHSVALSKVNCTQKSFTNILTFKNENHHWSIYTSTDSISAAIGSKLLGFLPTLKLQPRCNVELSSNEKEVQVEKATCFDWGQKLFLGSIDKDLHIESFVYDIKSLNVLVTMARYISYNKDGQLCKSGSKRRIAPAVSTQIVRTEIESSEDCPQVTKPLPDFNPEQFRPPAETQSTGSVQMITDPQVQSAGGPNVATSPQPDRATPLPDQQGTASGKLNPNDQNEGASGIPNQELIPTDLNSPDSLTEPSAENGDLTFQK